MAAVATRSNTLRKIVCQRHFLHCLTFVARVLRARDIVGSRLRAGWTGYHGEYCYSSNQTHDKSAIPIQDMDGWGKNRCRLVERRVIFCRTAALKRRYAVYDWVILLYDFPPARLSISTHSSSPHKLKAFTTPSRSFC